MHPVMYKRDNGTWYVTYQEYGRVITLDLWPITRRSEARREVANLLGCPRSLLTEVTQ